MTTDMNNHVIAAVAGLRALPMRHPSALADLLTVYQRETQAAVVSHGGTVVRFTGDALVAVWTREPRGAADAALRIVAIVRDLSNQFDSALEVSVGIADAEFVDARDGAVMKSVSAASAIHEACRASALPIGISKSLAPRLAALYEVAPASCPEVCAAGEVFTLAAGPRSREEDNVDAQRPARRVEPTAAAMVGATLCATAGLIFTHTIDSVPRDRQDVAILLTVSLVVASAVGLARAAGVTWGRTLAAIPAAIVVLVVSVFVSWLMACGSGCFASH